MSKSHTYADDEAVVISPTEPARGCIALAVYTGRRLGAVRAMQWGQIRNGMINVRQSKTGRELIVPLHFELQAALARCRSAR